MTLGGPVLVSIPDSSEFLPTSTNDGVMARIDAGEMAAIEECLIRYGDLVWSIARRFSATYADAEEAVQEIFVEVWLCADHFDVKVASVEIYVTMIARRILIDRRCRCNDKLQVRSRNDREALQSQAAGGRAKEKMRPLSDEKQRMLELVLAGRFSISDIAWRLSLSIETVKVLARDGLIELSAIPDVADSNSLSLPSE